MSKYSLPPEQFKMDSKPRVTFSLLVTIFAVAIGSPFLHGYNLGVTNPPQKVLEAFINESLFYKDGVYASEATVTNYFALAVSALCVGGLMGALLVAPISSQFGRKGGLVFNGIFALLGALLMGFSKHCMSHIMLIIGRYFVGMHAGISAGIAPLYYNEISPIEYRGAVGVVYQLVVVISILLSQILGNSALLGNAELWPYLLGGIAVCPIIMMLLFPFCPESPKFLLIVRNQEREAEAALRRLRGTHNVTNEMKAMNNEAQMERNQPKITMSQMLSNPALRQPLIIALMVMISQQLSGINAVIFFSTGIFMQAGLSETAAPIATVGMSIVNLLSTLVSMVIIEKAGRRSLLLSGMMGMLVCTVILTFSLGAQGLHPFISWLSIGGVFTFVIMFAIGPGSIPWFLVTELFGQSARPIASSLSVAVNWLFNIAVGMLFPNFMAWIGHYTFLVFTVCLAFFYAFTYNKLPETKGKTPEDIAAHFAVNRNVAKV